MVLTIDGFLTSAECDSYIAKASSDGGLRSPTIGKDAASARQRTSTTWHHKYSDATEILARTCEALGVEVGEEGSGLRRFEEVSVCVCVKCEEREIGGCEGLTA